MKINYDGALAPRHNGEMGQMKLLSGGFSHVVACLPCAEQAIK